MKIVDEYCDRENCKLNCIFHNAPESQAAQQSERVSDDVKFICYQYCKRYWSEGILHL